MSYESDKSVERKPKRRIVEDLPSDNSGSKDKTHHNRNTNIGEQYFHCLSTLIFPYFFCHGFKCFVPLL